MSKWAVQYIKELKEGKPISFRPMGNSMSPLIMSGSLVTCSPITAPLVVSDIVLCTVGRNDYLHIIKDYDPKTKKYLIGNNKGGTNGWIPRSQIHGVLLR